MSILTDRLDLNSNDEQTLRIDEESSGANLLKTVNLAKILKQTRNTDIETRDQAGSQFSARDTAQQTSKTRTTTNILQSGPDFDAPDD